jgi:hypothetical protein
VVHKIVRFMCGEGSRRSVQKLSDLKRLLQQAHGQSQAIENIVQGLVDWVGEDWFNAPKATALVSE